MQTKTVFLQPPVYAIVSFMRLILSTLIYVIANRAMTCIKQIVLKPFSVIRLVASGFRMTPRKCRLHRVCVQHWLGRQFTKTLCTIRLKQRITYTNVISDIKLFSLRKHNIVSVIINIFDFFSSSDVSKKRSRSAVLENLD